NRRRGQRASPSFESFFLYKISIYFHSKKVFLLNITLITREFLHMLFIHHPISKTRQIAYIVTMMRRTVSRIPLELIVWTTGLIYLALIDPHGAVPQFCIYKLAGFSGCPGCGLGSAVSHLLHGELQASWESHPL